MKEETKDTIMLILTAITVITVGYALFIMIARGITAWHSDVVTSYMQQHCERHDAQDPSWYKCSTEVK